MSENPLPLEYLVTSSQSAVESFELSRLNRVSNLRKEIRQVVDEWIAAEAEARIARWILDCRRAQIESADPLPATAEKNLPATPLSSTVAPRRCDPLPIEEIPLCAPYAADIPLWNCPTPMVEGKLAAPLTQISKSMKSHTAKAVLRLLEHSARGTETRSVSLQIRRRRVRLQSLATENSACSRLVEEQKIRPAPPMRSLFSGSQQYTRRAS